MLKWAKPAYFPYTHHILLVYFFIEFIKRNLYVAVYLTPPTLTRTHKLLYYFLFFSCSTPPPSPQQTHRDLIMNDCICLHGIYYRKMWICVRILPIKKLCGNYSYNGFSSFFFSPKEKNRILMQKRKRKESIELQ